MECLVGDSGQSKLVWKIDTRVPMASSSEETKLQYPRCSLPHRCCRSGRGRTSSQKPLQDEGSNDWVDGSKGLGCMPSILRSKRGWNEVPFFNPSAHGLASQRWLRQSENCGLPGSTTERKAFKYIIQFDSHLIWSTHAVLICKFC